MVEKRFVKMIMRQQMKQMREQKKLKLGSTEVQAPPVKRKLYAGGYIDHSVDFEERISEADVSETWDDEWGHAHMAQLEQSSSEEEWLSSEDGREDGTAGFRSVSSESEDVQYDIHGNVVLQPP